MVTAMFRFLEIELEVGLTFAKAAENAPSTEDLLHNRKLARRALRFRIACHESCEFDGARDKENYNSASETAVGSVLVG